MRKSTGTYPSLTVDTTAKRVVSHAGAMLLAATAGRVGLDRELSAALRPWMRPSAIHDPGKVLLDLALSVATGGDCLADIAQVRSEPALFGQVASDPTVSRLIDTLAADAPLALVAINRARAQVRARVWALAGTDAPDHDMTVKAPLIVDLDASLITAHSEKELAAATFKRGFGHHPIGAWVDHGDGGTGEPVAMILRKGNAGSNTAVDHIEVTKAALAQLPSTDPGRRPGRKVLIRTDGAGGTHDFIKWMTGQRLQYSVGFSLTDTAVAALELIPQSAWTPAYDAEKNPRDGAWVTELTGLLDLSGWPDGMRVIVRAERPLALKGYCRDAALMWVDPNGDHQVPFHARSVSRSADWQNGNIRAVMAQEDPDTSPALLGRATRPASTGRTQRRELKIALPLLPGRAPLARSRVPRREQRPHMRDRSNNTLRPLIQPTPSMLAVDGVRGNPACNAVTASCNPSTADPRRVNTPAAIIGNRHLHGLRRDPLTAAGNCPVCHPSARSTAGSLHHHGWWIGG